MGRFDEFYNTDEWKALRKKKFEDCDGLCEKCRAQGIVSECNAVHHLVPLDEDWRLRLDYKNLIGVCYSCHDEYHKRDSQLQKFERFWEDLQ